MTKIVEEFELYGKQYRLETGELAKQATGAVLVTCGATSVLVTAVVSSQEKDYDFFPLTVDYIEKMYAVGRIPGGYLKREAKPSDHGTLVARMVDRPIRPGFPDGYKNEVHIVATPFVIDGENLPDTICVAGASAALLVGGAPFDGPAACVRIGRDIETGEFIVNPTNSEQENSDLELTIAGTADYISMVEAGAAEISEEDMLAAMTFGQEAIAAFCEKQAAFLAKVNPTPMDYTIHAADPSVAERVDAHLDEMSAALKDADKAARMQKVEELKSSIIENDFTEEERAAWGSDIKAALKALEKRAMRAMILETGERVDGRTPEEIRPLYIVPGYLPRVHGSGPVSYTHLKSSSPATSLKSICPAGRAALCRCAPSSRASTTSRSAIFPAKTSCATLWWRPSWPPTSARRERQDSPWKSSSPTDIARKTSPPFPFATWPCSCSSARGSPSTRRSPSALWTIRPWPS